MKAHFERALKEWGERQRQNKIDVLNNCCVLWTYLILKFINVSLGHVSGKYIWIVNEALCNMVCICVSRT